MKNNFIANLNANPDLREKLLPYCRLKIGDIWEDSLKGHKIACGAADDGKNLIATIMQDKKAQLAIHDPPYNLVAFDIRELEDYIKWCRNWVEQTIQILAEDSSLYIWLGCDQNNNFQPLPDFMIMMREFKNIKPRSFITMRNQRGYGTHKNWMAVRQECLYYTRGNPPFTVQYTDIPKILRGYYKVVGGKKTETMERSKSKNIRASNVWVDIQQVFYRMQENVSGCYAQKPMKAIQRLIQASSCENDLVIDFFGHSGSTLLAAETTKRICYSVDIDPLYCEIMIRRLEHYRKTGLLGWQNLNPFAQEIGDNYDVLEVASEQRLPNIDLLL